MHRIAVQLNSSNRYINEHNDRTCKGTEKHTTAVAERKKTLG